MRRLGVRANADTPADAAKAREFGAEGIGLCRTEHMFFGDERLPIDARDDPGRDEERAPRRARPAAADAAGRLRGDLRGDGRPAGHDPAARPAAARVPAAARGGDRRADARPDPRAARGEPDARDARLPPRAAVCRRSTRCRCARSSAPRSPSRRTGEAPLVEIMHPLVGFAEELRRLRELTRARPPRRASFDYLVGTMIELPRACVRADEIAEVADFFSFGTNDLTQTTLGFSRDDAEGKFLTRLPRGRRPRARTRSRARPGGRRRPDADRASSGDAA